MKGGAALTVLGLLALAAACAGGSRVTARRAAPVFSSPPPAEIAPTAAGRAVESNVARGDYVGSATCAACHLDVAAAWARSSMHRMTRDAHLADVRAPFDGTRWRFKNDAVVLERRGGEPVVRIEPALGPTKTYVLTRVIGGRTREDFAGVDEEGGRDELVLPVSFMIATRSLRYKGYSVMVHERATLRAGPVWQRTCIFCHNTIPEMDRMLGALAGGAARAYQGETVERWLPADRRARVQVVDGRAFYPVLSGELARLGFRELEASADSGKLARRAVDVVRAGFDAGALVELGVGCEACHGGGRAHLKHSEVHPSLLPTAPWLDVALPGAGRAQAVNRVCARCHQVLFSRYPFTWEGGKRDASAGGSHISSGEARDFLLGGCADAMSCTTCHDPHGGGDGETLRRFASAAGNAICTRCHTDLGDRERARSHAHHDPDGPGGACVACHMPRKNMGLDGRLTRYHRIGSPTDPARVLGDRPLECALCHADRSVGALVDAMEAWWPVRYPRQRLRELYGSLEANTMRATLERGKPHEKVVAIATLGEARARDAAPLVARELLSDYPLVREWALRALVSMLGRCDVDLTADRSVIARQAAACGAGFDTEADRPGASHEEPHDEDPED